MIDIFSGRVYDLCMISVMVKEADLNRIDAPENDEVLDATALGRQLGFKQHTVLAYLSRRNVWRIPRPSRQLFFDSYENPCQSGGGRSGLVANP
jgi:hypothetical protein